jgi:hypothetical protein
VYLHRRFPRNQNSLASRVRAKTFLHVDRGRWCRASASNAAFDGFDGGTTAGWAGSVRAKQKRSSASCEVQSDAPQRIASSRTPRTPIFAQRINMAGCGVLPARTGRRLLASAMPSSSSVLMSIIVVVLHVCVCDESRRCMVKDREPCRRRLLIAAIYNIVNSTRL